MTIQIKRVYDTPAREDGFRVLVDRLWPRGLTKEKAEVDLWLKEAAPSTGLRKWFGHEPAKWEEFQKRYRAELAKNKAPAALLREKAKKETVTLLYGAKDQEHNQAVVLRSFLETPAGKK